MYWIGVIAMKKILSFLKKICPSKRKLVQLYFALLFNANIKGFVNGSIYNNSTKTSTKNFCIPGLNCYSCPGATGACPLGSLQDSYNAGRSTIFYVLGILLLFGVMFGRMICSWMCPFGFVQELTYKVKTKKVKKSRFTRILSYAKYVFLVVFVVIIPICYAFKDVAFPAFCKFICPAGTLEGAMGLLANKVNDSYFSMLGPLFTWKFLLMVSIIVGSIFIYRLFCRFICPLGALYGLFNRFSIFGLKLDDAKCTKCNLCVNKCKMDVYSVGDHECILCGECIDVCPTKAISWKGPKIFIKANDIPEKDDVPAAPECNKKREKLRLITRIGTLVIMLAVLFGAIAHYWIEADKAEKVVYETGSEVGMICPGYDLEIVTKDGPTGTTINPPETGKITIINFWYTMCTSCVAELPYFERIANEYENIDVIAVHSELTWTFEEADFIAKNYPDSKIIFVHDYAENSVSDIYYKTLGGKGAYPQTVILDENGVIVRIIVGSTTYDELKDIVDGIK